MSIFIRLSTQALTDPKFLIAGPEASWLWIKGLLYAKEHLTDGFIPSEVLPLLTFGFTNAEASLKALTDGSNPLWKQVDGGFTVGSDRWSKWQTTKEQVDDKREKSKTRLRNWREKQRNIDGNENETAFHSGMKRYQSHSTEPEPEPEPELIAIAHSSEHRVNTNTLASSAKKHALKAEPELLPPDQLAGTLPLVSGTDYQVSKTQVADWKEAFPAVDVTQQLKEMKVWIQANPTKRKTRRGIAKFVVSWLSRAQDKPHPNRTGDVSGSSKQDQAGRVSAAVQRQHESDEALRNIAARRYGVHAPDEANQGPVHQPAAPRSDTGDVPDGVGGDGSAVWTGGVSGRVVDGNTGKQVFPTA